jgi:DNA-directed RNA polymerase specialized sigma24 family protein
MHALLKTPATAPVPSPDDETPPPQVREFCFFTRRSVALVLGLLPEPDGGETRPSEARDALRTIANAIAAMRPEIRQTFLLRIILGRSYRDIAVCLAVPAEVVARRIVEARESVRRSLATRTAVEP